jgi:hypothetical protein
MYRLWAPFVAPRPAGEWEKVTIAASPEWTASSSWKGSLSTPDVWLMANEVRYLLVERAIELAPEVVVLHAAALSKGSSIVVLAGESGIGKTTLTLDLLTRGWSYLSDDVVPVLRSGDVLPFPKPMGVKDRPRWEEYWGASGDSWPPVPEEGFLVPPPEGRIARDGGSPRLLVFLGQQGDGFSWEEVSPGQAVLRAQALVRTPSRAALENLSELCRRTPAVDLISSSSRLSAQILDNRVAR